MNWLAVAGADDLYSLVNKKGDIKKMPGNENYFGLGASVPRRLLYICKRQIRPGKLAPRPKYFPCPGIFFISPFLFTSEQRSSAPATANQFIGFLVKYHYF